MHTIYWYSALRPLRPIFSFFSLSGPAFTFYPPLFVVGPLKEKLFLRLFVTSYFFYQTYIYIKIGNYSTQLFKNDNNIDYTYKIIILDSNSEMGAHVRSNLCYLICIRHLIRSRAVTIVFFLREYLFSSTLRKQQQPWLQVLWITENCQRGFFQPTMVQPVGEQQRWELDTAAAALNVKIHKIALFFLIILILLCKIQICQFAILKELM